MFQRLTIVLAILAGCAGRQEQDTFASLRAEIRAERAKTAARDRRIAELTKAPAARPAPASEPRPVADAPASGAPATAGLAFPPGMLAPYGRQDTLYAGRPPLGWGASPLSLVVRNAATREVPGAYRRQHFCYLGVEIDEEQGMTVRPDRAMGAAPWVLLPVTEGSIVRTVPLIPPGGAARVVLDEVGLHSARFRCYVGPPRPVTLPDGTVVPALQLWSEWTTTLQDTPELTVDHFRLTAVSGLVAFH